VQKEIPLTQQKIFKYSEKSYAEFKGLQPETSIGNDYRPDIDGLRALAILAVLAFHVAPISMPGGFLGVDVFFVVSGFLITQQVLRSVRTKRFSLAEFYIRRARRLLPALLVTLALTSILGFLTLYPIEIRALGAQILAGTWFSANILFWWQSGYFDTAGLGKPLLHLWSLAVEEQFYLVQPLFLLICLKRRWPTAQIIFIALAASLALCLVFAQQKGSLVFFSPFTRAWELLAGAMCVFYGRTCPKTETYRLVNLLYPTAFFGLLFSFIVIDKSKVNEGWWAITVVASTAILILLPQKSKLLYVALSSRFATAVGRLSYPLYLIHWPLLSFGHIIYGESMTLSKSLFCIFIALVLSWGINRWIEYPIRLCAIKDLPIGLFASCIAAISITGLIMLEEPKWTPMGKHPAAARSYESMWPKLVEVRSVCGPLLGNEVQANCSAWPSDVKVPQIILLGDSHARAIAIGLSQLTASTPPWLYVGKNGCLPFLGVERFDERGPLSCAAISERSIDWVIKHKPAVVILASRYAYYVQGQGYGTLDQRDRHPDNLHIQAPGPRLVRSEDSYKHTFGEGLRSTLRTLKNNDIRVIFVHQVPEMGFDPNECLPRPFGGGNRICTLDRNLVEDRQRSYRQISEQVLSEFPSVKEVDPMNMLCNAKLCTAERDGERLYRDDDHLSLSGSRNLAKLLLTHVLKYNGLEP
jgi:peptidoglycan/LPS O-acetylase OafA/YrhL